MKTVAYLRVSTAQQDAGSQRLAILEYARRQGFRIDDFIEATASARTNAKHRRLDQLMAVLEPGDRLVVGELSRLGRSLGESVSMNQHVMPSVSSLRTSPLLGSKTSTPLTLIWNCPGSAPPPSTGRMSMSGSPKRTKRVPLPVKTR